MVLMIGLSWDGLSWMIGMIWIWWYLVTRSTTTPGDGERGEEGDDEMLLLPWNVFDQLWKTKSEKSVSLGVNGVQRSSQASKLR